MRGWLGMAGVVLLLALAGCGEAAKPPAEVLPEGAEELQLEVTDDTGILRGVVVDEAVRPLAGVEVRLVSDPDVAPMTTTSSGVFGFDGLQPGDHVVAASRPGYLDVQATAAVVAGAKSPPFLRLVLATNGTYQEPFNELRHITGFIQCTGNPVALCSIPNNYRPTACSTHPALCYDNVTSDTQIFELDFLGNTSFLQAEMAWKPSSSLSQQMGWNHVAGTGCAGLEGHNNATYGESPLVAPMVPRDVRKPGGDPCRLFLGITAGPPNPAACLPVQVPLFNTLCVGAAFSQSFELYLTAFYGYLPPEGWTFTADGDAPPG